MRVYLKRCETEKIEFSKVRYAIPSTALTNGNQFTLNKYGCETVDWIGYADALVLFFNDAETLQRGLKLLNETFERYKLEINISKTKTMILNFNKESG